MATGAEIAGYIINGLLSARKYATKRIEQFTKMRLLSREVNFYDPIQRITIATLLKKEEQRTVISVLKEDHWLLNYLLENSLKNKRYSIIL